MTRSTTIDGPPRLGWEDVLEAMTGRLDRLEQKLDAALAAAERKDWYTTAEVAAKMGVSEYTCREWCRMRRIHAEKREAGRGRSRPWMVPHAELERLKREGLLPLRLAGD